MSRFSRSDKVEGIFQAFYANIEYSGDLVSGIYAHSGTAGLVNDSSLTFHFWRENGKVYLEGEIRTLIFPGTHICLGRFPEGFRPKQQVYIGKGCGWHTADIQLRVDPSGFLDLWANSKNPAWYGISVGGTKTNLTQLNGWFSDLINDPWVDGITRTSTYRYVQTGTLSDEEALTGTTNSPMDIVGFRCNSCWDVEY